VICLVSGQTPYTTICQKEKPKGYLPFICLKYCEIADQDCHLGGTDYQGECTQEEAANYIELRKCTLQACKDYLENCVYDEDEYCLSPACATFCNYYPENNNEEYAEVDIDCSTDSYLYMLKACQDTLTDTKTIIIDNEDLENSDIKSSEELTINDDTISDIDKTETNDNNQKTEISNSINDQASIKLQPVEQQESTNTITNETEKPILETDKSTEIPTITEINSIPKDSNLKPDQKHTHSSSSKPNVDNEQQNLIEHGIDNSNYRDSSNHNIFSSISVSGIVYGIFFICNCFLIMMIMNNSRKIAKLEKKVELNLRKDIGKKKASRKYGKKEVTIKNN